MWIYVCSLLEMESHVRRLAPRRLVSLVRADEQPPTPAGVRTEHHLRLEIDDISDPLEGHILPSELHVRRLIDFLRAQEPDEALLVHCVAGISRSTAAALVALALDAEGRELEAAQRLREAAPHALPNRRIIELADHLLERRGRLLAAREAMGPAELAPLAPLVRLPRRF